MHKTCRNAVSSAQGSALAFETNFFKGDFSLMGEFVQYDERTNTTLILALEGNYRVPSEDVGA